MTGRLWLPVVVIAGILGLFVVIQPVWGIGLTSTRNPAQVVALVPSTTTVDAGRYDSWHSPRGQEYCVPAGSTLNVGRLMGVGGPIEVGYGSTSVSNSAAAPDNAVTIWSSGATHQALSQTVSLDIPAGACPWVRQISHNGAVSAAGVER